MPIFSNVQLAGTRSEDATYPVRNVRGRLTCCALMPRGGRGRVEHMNTRTMPAIWLKRRQRCGFGHGLGRAFGSGLGWMLAGVLMLMAAPAVSEPPAGAVAAFDAYAKVVETKLDRQHTTAAGEFLSPVESADAEARLRRGEMVIEKLGGKDVPGAMLHHWRGTAFVAGATGADFERLMRNFGEYPSRFAPQVVSAKVLSQHGDQYQVMMRVRQKHVITVVMDTAYEVTFGRVDARRGFSTSRSTRVTEIADAGTPQERALAPDEEHGFLWRQNTYWSYEERDGGLYMQIESVSLSRGIPRGLGWVIGPYVQSVPRESLEFTLGRVKDALGSKKGG